MCYDYSDVPCASPVDSPHKGPLLRKTFPDHNVILHTNLRLHLHLPVPRPFLPTPRDHVAPESPPSRERSLKVPSNEGFKVKKSGKPLTEFLPQPERDQPLWKVWHGPKHGDVIKWKHFPRYWPFARGFPSHRPVTRSSGVFFDLCLNKRFSKQSKHWRFAMPWRSLWRHCNGSNKTYTVRNFRAH